MASIGSELKTYLKTINAVTTLIGAGTVARIYQHSAKQAIAMPYVLIEVFIGTSNQHINGISGIATNRIQIDAYAATETEAYALAEAIRLAPLQMFRGTMGATTVHGVSSTEGYESGYEPPVKGGNQKRYFFSRDYFVTYSEAVTA